MEHVGSIGSRDETELDREVYLYRKKYKTDVLAKQFMMNGIGSAGVYPSTHVLRDTVA